MEIKDVMTRNVTCVAPDTALQEIARIMKSQDIGFVPVCQNDRLIGAVTDRDMVLRAVTANANLAGRAAKDVMTEGMRWRYEDQTVEEVADYMAAEEVRRVCILDRDKRLVGVVSIGDLAKGGSRIAAGEAIRTIAKAPRAA